MTVAAPAPAPGSRLDTLRPLPVVLRGWRAWYALTIAWNVLVHLAAAAGAAGAAWAVSLAVQRSVALQSGSGDPGAHASVSALLWLPTVLVLGATVVRAIAQWQESYTSHDLSFRVMARIRMWVFDALGRIAPAGLVGRRRGDVSARAMGDCEVLEIFYAHSSLYMIGRVVVTPILVLALAVVSPMIALVSIPFLVLLWLVPTLTRRPRIRWGDRIRTLMAQMGSDMQENVGAVREIVAFGLLPQRRGRLDDMQRELARLQRRTAALTAVDTALSGVVASALAITATAVGVGEVGAGRLDLVALPAAVALAGAIPSAILQWIATQRHRGNVAAAAERIADLLDAPDPLPVRTAADPAGGPSDGVGTTASDSSSSPTSPAPSGVVAPSDAPALDLRHVSFTWPGAPQPAVDGVDLQIPVGQTVAIAGRSGAGKSTLAQLLARWYDPSTGTISAAGRDLRALDREALPQQVRLVPQDPHLFAESVRENLQLARADEISDEEMWQALRSAGAEEVVAGMPDGLDTVLADHGRSLSGGERQRIALARAVLAPAPVLILDESVSQLDTGTAASVQSALLRPGTTTVVIAHRLVTLLQAERIVVMDGGRVVGDGRHEDLLASCPAYRALVEPQLR